MEEHKIKDEILKNISKNGKSCNSDISNDISLEYYKVQTYINEFINLGYVEYSGINKWVNIERMEKEFKLTYHGFFFLEKGGFTSIKNAETKKQRLIIAKEVMIHISTVAIIIVTWFNYIATDKANDNKVEADKCEYRIAQLEKQNDSLRSIIKDTLHSH